MYGYESAESARESFLFISHVFPITDTAALYYSLLPVLQAYFICIILCKYVSRHCVMHLKRFSGGESYRSAVRGGTHDSHFLITICRLAT